MRRRLVLVLLLGGAALALAAAGAFRGRNPATPPVSPREGTPGLLRLEAWPVTPEVRRGRVVYEENCLGCHGEDGKGDGPAAAWLDPVPRNFQKSRFKFRSSASSQLPFEDDVLHTVTCGLPGSAMPGFPLVSEQQRKDVVAYVLDLAVFNEAGILAQIALQSGEMTEEQILADMPGLRRKAIERALGRRERMIAQPYPPSTPASIATGRGLYMKLCASCHGNEGRGDGSSSYTLRDWQDAAIIPRDFTSGVFRGGSSPTDVFLRIKTGLNGTPMPSTSESDENAWSLVHYVFSVQAPDRIPLTRRMGCDRKD